MNRRNELGAAEVAAREGHVLGETYDEAVARIEKTMGRPTTVGERSRLRAILRRLEKKT